MNREFSQRQEKQGVNNNRSKRKRSMSGPFGKSKNEALNLIINDHQYFKNKTCTI